MNKRRRFKAKSRRLKVRQIANFHAKMRGRGHRDYYTISLDSLRPWR